jgi:hypothetical protein
MGGDMVMEWSLVFTPLQLALDLFEVEHYLTAATARSRRDRDPHSPCSHSSPLLTSPCLSALSCQ